MARWRTFEQQRPDLADAGGRLLYQYGVGLAFLATTSRDGAPRVHPICPILHAGGLYALILPSPKRDDLRRDGRLALHTFPCDDNEDAFVVAGVARAGLELTVVEDVRARFLAERGMSRPPPRFEEQEAFELDLLRCLHTVTVGHGDPEPRHTVWRDTGGA